MLDARPGFMISFREFRERFLKLICGNVAWICIYFCTEGEGRGMNFMGMGQEEDYDIIVMLFLAGEPVFNLFSHACTPPPGNFGQGLNQNLKK